MFAEIKKVIFPAAGLGTRFSPITKIIPKEVLPVVDKPLMHFAIEEAIEAGITEMIFIINENKTIIKEYINNYLELNNYKKANEDSKQTSYLLYKNASQSIHCIYITQIKPLGLGHAVYLAKDYVGHEPFAILLPDELLNKVKQSNCLQEMIEQYALLQGNIIAVKKVNKEDAKYYGIVELDDELSNNATIRKIIEKPLQPEKSQFAAIGRYIFSSAIFNHLEKSFSKTNGEYAFTEAIQLLCADAKVYAYSFTGDRYDCGRKIGYLDAVIAYSLKCPEIAQDFKLVLKKYSTILQDS